MHEYPPNQSCAGSNGQTHTTNVSLAQGHRWGHTCQASAPSGEGARSAGPVLRRALWRFPGDTVPEECLCRRPTAPCSCCRTSAGRANAEGAGDSRAWAAPEMGRACDGGARPEEGGGRWEEVPRKPGVPWGWSLGFY